MPSSEFLLEASALEVARGRRTVLAGVDVSLAGGTAVHLVGANGSGKTSLLRVLAGLSAPRAGSLRRRAACAFVPEKVALASALRAGEWLRAMRRLRGLAPLDWPSAAGASGLDPAVLARSSATFSKGMLQRIALLEALHSGGALLLLDEPFAGLDAEGRDWLAGALAARLDAGAAALLTDHSGAAGDRLALAGRLTLRDGTARAGAGIAAAGGTAGPGAAAAAGAPAGAAALRGADSGAEAAAPGRHAAVGAAHAVPASPNGRAAATVIASHPDGRRLEHAVAASDDLLRELLAGGWHIEQVRR